MMPGVNWTDVPWHPVQGQRLYVPAYSRVYHQMGDPHLLTVTLNIRNTNVHREIVVTSVRYYNTAGKKLATAGQAVEAESDGHN